MGERIAALRVRITARCSTSAGEDDHVRYPVRADRRLGNWCAQVLALSGDPLSVGSYAALASEVGDLDSTGLLVVA